MIAIDLGHPDPPHNISKIEQANGQRIYDLMRAVPMCATCKEKRHLVQMPGDGWGFAHHHQRHCPQHEDNHPTPTRETP